MPDLLIEKAEKPPMWQRVLMVGGVIVLFVVGVLGSIFPIIPGFPFLIAAVVMMPMAIPKTRAWVNRLDRKLSYEHRLKVRRAIKKVPIKKIREMVRA